MIPILPIGIGAILLWWLWESQSMSFKPIHGTEARDMIIDAFRAAFYDYPGCEYLARAAAVNAYAESRWYSDAIGDSGAAVGLFQVHENGAGKGIALPRTGLPGVDPLTGKGISNMPNPVDPRFDVKVNIDIMVNECKRSSSIMNAIRGDTSVESMTYLFCVYAERPEDSSTRGMERVELIEQLGLGF